MLRAPSRWSIYIQHAHLARSMKLVQSKELGENIRNLMFGANTESFDESLLKVLMDQVITVVNALGSFMVNRVSRNMPG